MKMVCLTRLLPGVLGIIVLSLTSVAAQAELIYVGTNFDIEVSSPVDVGVTPLRAVILTAVGKNGFLPNTFDSTKSGFGGTGITTVGDSLHQVWEFGAFPTPILTLTADTIPQDLDTHFLIETGQYLAGALAPTENRPTTDLTEDPRAGFGNSMTGTFSLTGSGSPTWDFAYLVVPNGTEVFLDFEISGVDLDDNGYSDTVTGSLLVVPEPSMLLLLVLGALGLLVKRVLRGI